MVTRIIIIVIGFFCACGACAQSITDSPLLNQNPTRHGFSTHLAFELTTPTGSGGRWTTGGGGTVTIAYTYYFDNNWFISPGAGAFYNTMGTDFLPEYDFAYEGTVKNYGARVPLLGGYKFRLGDDLSLSVATGPLINFSIYAKEHPAPDFDAPVVDPGEPINLFGKGFHRVDLMWSFFAGLTYKGHYCIGIQGAAGMTNAATMTWGQRKLNIHRNNIALMLSYTF